VNGRHDDRGHYPNYGREVTDTQSKVVSNKKLSVSIRHFSAVAEQQAIGSLEAERVAEYETLRGHHPAAKTTYDGATSSGRMALPVGACGETVPG